MRGINKKIWIGIVILVVIILVAGVWFFIGENKADEKQNSSGNLSNSLSQSLLKSKMKLDAPYDSIDSLNKSRCLEIENDYFKTLCENGINLIEKAMASRNISVCFDKSISVNTRIRTMCLQKFGSVNKTNN